jgi:hypothetical protein
VEKDTFIKVDSKPFSWGGAGELRIPGTGSMKITPIQAIPLPSPAVG